MLCSAAIHPLGDVVETDEATWDRTFEVNVKSMYLCCHYGVPHMIKRGGGSIITLSSVQATSNTPNVCAYAATKGAILTFTHTLAVDLAKYNIRANTICPGSIITPMQEHFARLNGAGRSAQARCTRSSLDPCPCSASAKRGRSPNSRRFSRARARAFAPGRNSLRMAACSLACASSDRVRERQRSMRRIDCHMHHWTLALERYYGLWMTPELKPLYGDFGPRDAAPVMAQNGIDGVVLVSAANSIHETGYLMGVADSQDYVRGVVA